MSADSPQTPREELEARLTALLLGEASHEEAAELHRRLAADKELAALYERLKRTIELVRAATGDPVTPAATLAPLKLGERRREQLLEHLKTVPLGESRPSRRRNWVRVFAQAAAVVAVMGILVLLLLPALSKSKGYSGKSLSMQSAAPLQERELEQASENKAKFGLANLPAGRDKTGSIQPGNPVSLEDHVKAQDLPATAAIVLPSSPQDTFSERPEDVTKFNLSGNNFPIGGKRELDLPVTSVAAVAPGVSGSSISSTNYVTPSESALTEPKWALIPNEPPATYSQTNPFVGRYAYSSSPPLSPEFIPNAAKPAAAPAATPQPLAESVTIPGLGDTPMLGTLFKSVTNDGRLERAAAAPVDQEAFFRNVNGAMDARAESNGILNYHQPRSPVELPPRAVEQIRSQLSARAASLYAGTSAVQLVEKGSVASPPSQQDRIILPAVTSGSDGDARISVYKKTTSDNSPGRFDRVPTGGESAGVVHITKDLKAPALQVPAGADAPARTFDGGHDVPARRVVSPAPEPQPEVATISNAFSTFSLNVSDVSFKLAAASLEKGSTPEPGSIRSEEFINAFDYRDPVPAPGMPVGFAWERARYPFAHNRDLLRFSVTTAATGRAMDRPLNLVLLLDNSGSMERADRVRIIHEALRVLAAQLHPQDRLSVVTFARTARLWADGIPGDQAQATLDQVAGLTPQGGTNLEEALKLAYDTALRHYLASGINRVVLLTDGAANLGDVDPASLKLSVETRRQQGVALDSFGVGWEGYNDDLLEVLARAGDGRYGFLNSPEEAAGEFAGQLAGALRVAARNLKVQVEFNPRRVTAYRQIGYAKHQLTKEQFRDPTVAAAQIGAAESGNALYVIAVNPDGDGPLGTVRVRYQAPDSEEYQEHEWTLPFTGAAVSLGQSSPAMRLAACAGAFSEWLASSPYAAEVTPDALLGLLNGVAPVYGVDARPQRLEGMIRQAKSITGK